LIANTSNEEVRCAALDALALLIFIGNSDENFTLSSLTVFSNIFNSEESKASEKAAALKAWSLLTTTINTKLFYSMLIPQYLSTFFTLLHDEDVEVRVQAGQCIALLFEVAREDEEEFNLNDVGAYASVDVDELLNVLYNLSQDKTKQRARKDKLKQKVPFKEIINTVELGQFPVESLSFKFQKFEFETWVKILQLDAIRDALGPGLQIHFESNDLLQQIFNIQVDKDAKKITLSQTEKRLMFSPSSPLAKARTKNLHKLRASRENQVFELTGEINQE